jgi:predicted small integral membrane protein
VNIDLLKGVVKKSLGYGIGNALNTAAMILLLPTFVHLSGTNGYFSAQGMLIAQVASIFGSYTFSLTIPRALEILNVELKKALLYEIIIFQIVIGIFGISVIFLLNKDFTLPGLCSYLIVYSSVVQWQWLHITNKTSHIQAILLLTSRMAIIILEVYAMNLVNPSQQVEWLFSALITAAFCLTILPTIFLFSIKEITKNIIKRRFGILIMGELKKGRQLFLASLLTSIYSLGPSVIVSLLNPPLLILIQQFDRIRMAVSNASGMLLSTVYPLLIGVSKGHLMSGFKIENPNASKSCGCGSSFTVEGEESDSCGGCGYSG